MIWLQISGNWQYGADKLVCIIRHTPTATAKEIIMETTISIEIEIPIEEFEKKLLETCEKYLTNN
jgi:hypothetical protein